MTEHTSASELSWLEIRLFSFGRPAYGGLTNFYKWNSVYIVRHHPLTRSYPPDMIFAANGHYGTTSTEASPTSMRRLADDGFPSQSMLGFSIGNKNNLNYIGWFRLT